MEREGHWGAYMQGNEQFQEIDELGKKLSLAIQCAVHYPAFGKNIFECECGVTFPVYIVKGRSKAKLAELHNERKGNL